MSSLFHQHHRPWPGEMFSSEKSPNYGDHDATVGESNRTCELACGTSFPKISIHDLFSKTRTATNLFIDPNPMFACGRRRPWEGGTLAPLGGSGRGPRPIGTVGTAVRQVVPPGSLGNPAPAPPPSPFGTRRGRRRRVDATRRLPVLDRGLSLPKCPHASFFFHVGLILHF